jgi:hypothetical protein
LYSFYKKNSRALLKEILNFEESSSECNRKYNRRVIFYHQHQIEGPKPSQHTFVKYNKCCEIKGGIDDEKTFLGVVPCGHDGREHAAHYGVR